MHRHFGMSLGTSHTHSESHGPSHVPHSHPEDGFGEKITNEATLNAQIRDGKICPMPTRRFWVGDVEQDDEGCARIIVNTDAPFNSPTAEALAEALDAAGREP